jgi:hypothetical protein
VGDKGHHVLKPGRALERRTFMKVRRKDVKQKKGMAGKLLMGLDMHKEEGHGNTGPVFQNGAERG